MQSVVGWLFNPIFRQIYLATILLLSQLDRSIVDRFIPLLDIGTRHRTESHFPEAFRFAVQQNRE